MLVLTRKVNQQIRLGDDITVTILRVQGNSIRIGVEAPRDVRVIRGELNPLNQESQLDQKDGQAQANNAQVNNGSAVTNPLISPTDSAPAMLEFDLEDIDAETLQSLEQEADRSPERPKVYHLRTSAPLARFFPPQTRETVNSYSVS